MSALVARQPLHQLPMSSIQRGTRRLSARLQEKDEPQASGAHGNGKASSAMNVGVVAKKTNESASANTRKRKNGYDEDDDGFAFTRVKKRQTRTSTSQTPVAPSEPESEPPAVVTRSAIQSGENEEGSEPVRKRRNKMSFSTPKISEPKPVRRSKRLSDENDLGQGSPRHKARRKDSNSVKTAPIAANGASSNHAAEAPRDKTPAPALATTEITADDHSATRIALPFADTPVIRRNKAMREGKSGKGERRSSLGLRGRRASSLIESGNSNALPHAEVEVQDFYKHIESESLPEPKRMRQLLTWCATRALSDKPTGTAFEDVSVKQAARIIQEELLKDFANKSEMSDWFGREDAPKPSFPLEERSHPKNVQNVEKIEELEAQIKRLRSERDSLQSLLRPPVIPSVPETLTDASSHSPLDRTLLSETDAALLNTLGTFSSTSSDISKRLNSIDSSLGPTIDAFADGIHKMRQYRNAADNVASRTLAICAEKLSEREEQGRKRALQEGDFNPRRDLGSVLRGLSQLDK